MITDRHALLLEQEARALLMRLRGMRPFVLQETVVPAAGLAAPTLAAVEHFLAEGRRELASRVSRYLDWLEGPGREASPAEMQRRFVLIRLRFNQVITHFDLFSDAITQRSEHDNGVWLAGLDVAAADGLRLPGPLTPPPVMCYLDRGPGAAIRRARTRLPGGARMPVSVVRIPRERMIGYGIASSLYHEVGHQAAALVQLVPSLTPALQARRRRSSGRQAVAWEFLERWISEVVADMWSVGHVGLAATLGLIAVVSLPGRFVFRIATDDPHPAPYVRVKISSAIGSALVPHQQWTSLAGMWDEMYPTARLDRDTRETLAALETVIPAFVETIVTHRPRALEGRSVREVLPMTGQLPEALLARWHAWNGRVDLIAKARPSLAFAVVAQARVAGLLSARAESRLLSQLLRRWAVATTLAALDTAAAKQTGVVPARPPTRALALAG